MIARETEALDHATESEEPPAGIEPATGIGYQTLIHKLLAAHVRKSA
jgi:hypothetical protein